MTLARSGDMINAMPHEKSYTLMHMTLARSFMLQTSSRDMRIADPTPVQQSFCVHLHLHWEGNETITVTFLTNETSGIIHSLSPLLYDHKDGTNLVLFQNRGEQQCQ